ELGQQLPQHSGPAKPTLWLQPGDLMTSTGETAIRVIVESGGAPVDADLLGTIASVAQLRSFPDLATVPVTITTHIPELYKAPADNPTKEAGASPRAPFDPNDRAYVELQPKSKLPDSWYVLSLSTVPA